MDLRREGHELVKLGVKPNPSNLAGRIVGTEEFELIKANLEKLEDKVHELFDSKSVTDVIKAEAKLSHFETRFKIFNYIIRYQ